MDRWIGGARLFLGAPTGCGRYSHHKTGRFISLWASSQKRIVTSGKSSSRLLPNYGAAICKTCLPSMATSAAHPIAPIPAGFPGPSSMNSIFGSFCNDVLLSGVITNSTILDEPTTCCGGMPHTRPVQGRISSRQSVQNVSRRRPGLLLIYCRTKRRRNSMQDFSIPGPPAKRRLTTSERVKYRELQILVKHSIVGGS